MVVAILAVEVGMRMRVVMVIARRVRVRAVRVLVDRVALGWRGVRGRWRGVDLRRPVGGERARPRRAVRAAERREYERDERDEREADHGFFFGRRGYISLSLPTTTSDCDSFVAAVSSFFEEHKPSVEATLHHSQFV